MRLSAALLAVAMLVGAGWAEAAATLTSGSLSFEAGVDGSCDIVNVSRRDLEIQVGAFSADGSGFLASCPPVHAGATCTAVFAGPADHKYCKVVVSGGGKSSVRATWCNVSSGNCSELR
jgi:hypothetical protein